jgi:hypothetical protein
MIDDTDPYHELDVTTWEVVAVEQLGSMLL